MKIKITSDSTSDLGAELIKKCNIGILPVRITLADKEYEDGVNITTEELFSLVDKVGQLPKTAADNPVDYEDFFTKQLASDGGYDAIIHFTLSSQISSLNQNAQIAAQSFDNKVFVIDSLSLSTGIGMQILYAYDLIQKGLSAQEIYTKVLERRSSVQASFVIETLKYLFKGGRCSRLAMFGANLLKIRPVIALKEGKMDVDSKLRGKYKDVVRDYVNYTLNKYNTPDKSFCFITYTTLEDEIVEMIKEMLKPIFKEIYVTRASSTISSHCGPNTIGILYYNDGK